MFAVANVLRLIGRLVARGIARVVDWFSAEPRRIRVATATLTVSAAVGATIGIVVGALLAGCWSVAHSVVLGDLT
jgi:hypothetical protein